MAGPRLYINNFTTSLANGISDSATTVIISSTTGLPTIAGGEYYYLTLDNGLGTVEIIKVTARTTTTLTVVRAQEGTTAVAWPAGTVVDMRGTADSFNPSTILSGQVLTTVTPASGDKILLQDDSDDDNLKVALFSDFGGGSSDSFSTISVSGQSDVVADSATDTLTLVAGTNVTITTDAGADSITINASGGGGGGGGQDAYTTTATSGGTTTLTVSSDYQQFFTGSTAGDVVVMPVTSTLTLGYSWLIVNNSTVSIDVQSSGANSIVNLAAGTAAILTCILTSGTTAASWAYNYASSIGGIFYPYRNNTGNITLTGASAYLQYYNDSGSVNCTMPVAATLVNGQSWCWVNDKSSGDIVVYASDNTTLLLTIPIGYKAEFTCIDNAGGTGAAPWVWDICPISGGVILPVIRGGTGVNAMPSAGVILGSNQTGIATGTYTKVLLNSVTYDTGSYYDNATNYRYTPLKAGKYLVSAFLTWEGTSDAMYMIGKIYKNGTPVVANFPRASGTASQGMQVTGVIDCNGSTDYIEIYCYQNSGSDKTLNAGSTGVGIGWLCP